MLGAVDEGRQGRRGQWAGAAAGAGGRQRLGRWGEDLAADWYLAQGFEVLARNWARSTGEVDLVARRGGLLVFCEVKARSCGAFGAPSEAVGRAKQARLRRMAAIWLAEQRRVATGPRQCLWSEVRFDVASVVAGRLVEVVRGAF
jgi:putative endonuclease